MPAWWPSGSSQRRGALPIRALSGGLAIGSLLLGILVPVVCSGAASAQSSEFGASLEPQAIEFRLGARRAGQKVSVYAIGLGLVDQLVIGADGRARLDLSRRRPPPGGACFFLIGDRSNEIMSLSSRQGFRNPFWEGSATASRRARAAKDVEADLAALETDVASARQTLATLDGMAIRNGECVFLVDARAARPPFAFPGVASRHYGAARCAPVIGGNPTCKSIAALPGFGNDTAFSGPACTEGLRDAFTVVRAGGAAGTQQTAIVDRALAAARATPADRPAIAAGCIRDVSRSSDAAFRAWREAEDAAEVSRQQRVSSCRAARDILTDEAARRTALTAELAEARTRPDESPARRSGPGAASREARDHPCAPRSQAGGNSGHGR